MIDIKQTHSNLIYEYQGKPLSDIEGDGIIIDPKKYSQISLAIKTADCLPVLFLGKKIAFVHAGWRGLHNKILIDQKIQDLDITDIYIGPFIKSFEVQSEFKQFFPQSNHFLKKDERLFFDLEQEAKDQLIKTYPNANIEVSPICTLENNSYNSFRRNKTTLRNWNIFTIK